MDIVVGSTGHIPPIRPKQEEIAGHGGLLEAKVLKVRPTRRGHGAPPVGDQDRRSEDYDYDPASGRILMLLLPDGSTVPKDLDSTKYRVFVRFSSK